MRRFQPLFAAAIFALLLTPAAAAVEGTVVTARVGEHPLLLWDCSPVVARIVAQNQPRDGALRSLEAQAVGVASSRLASVGQARDLTVRAIYQKTGAVSPVYKTATLEGVEEVFDLTIDVKALKSGETALSHSLEQGAPPPGVKLTIVGALPPD